MVSIKKLLNKILGSVVMTKDITYATSAISGDWRGTIEIPITLPTDAEIVAITIHGTPNGHWFRAQVGWYNNTTIALCCHNEYSGELSASSFRVLVAYKLLATPST